MSNPYQYLPVSNEVYGCQPKDLDPCEPCQKLAALDEKIKTMPGTTVEMERERLELKEQINSTHNRLTRYLPVEVIIEIMKRSLPDNIVDISLKTVTSRYTLAAPLVLSAVSRRWRDIMHSTPQLWTDLPLHLDFIWRSNIHSTVTLAKEWLERSDPYPLSINIYASEMTGQVEKMIQLVNQYSSRWMHLKFAGPIVALSRFASSAEGVSQLQTLILHPGAVSASELTIVGTFNLGKVILRPRRLEMVPLRVLKKVNIDWSNLQDLTIATMCVSDCLEVLRNAPRLKKCALAPSVPRRPNLTQDYFPLPRNPIVHPTISDLSVVGHCYGEIFAHLSCPSLGKLLVGGKELRLQMDPVVEFMQTSKCSVTNLTLLGINCSEEDIDLLCKRVSTIQSLCIQPLPAQEYLFTLLAQVSTVGGKIKPLYLPDLRLLRVSNNVTPNWDLLPAIFRLPQSSVRHRKYLDSVQISIKPDEKLSDTSMCVIEKETRVQLLSLREQGVRLKIRFGGMDLI